MSQNRNRNTSQHSAPNLPVHVVEKILENQSQQVFNQGQELKLREKELETNSRLAEKQMGLQAEILKARPAETRKNFQVVGTFILIFIALILFFFVFCAMNGHGDFALKIFGYLMYAVVTIAGYYAGRKSAQKESDKKDAEIQEAQLVE